MEAHMSKEPLFVINYPVTEETANQALQMLKEMFPDLPNNWHDLTPKQKKQVEVEIKIIIADTIDSALQVNPEDDLVVPLDELDEDNDFSSLDNEIDIDAELDKLYR